MSASAGWYADPQDPKLLRYFDGASWTTQTQPAAAAQPSAGPAAGAQAPVQQPSWAPQSQQPTPTGQQPGWGQQGQQPRAAQPGQFQQGQFQGQQGQHGQQGQFQQGQFQGQQTGWNQGPSPLANQFTAQPRQPGFDPSFGGAPSGTPTAVKLWIVGALVAIVAFMGIGLAIAGGDDKADEKDPDELSAALSDALGEDSFDCTDLGKQAVELSASDTDALLSTSGLTPTKDRRSTVEVPASGETVALACKGDGEWSDGAVEPIELELRLDSAGDAWVYYSER